MKINSILVLLDDYLIPGKRRIKLTFSDGTLAERLNEEGHTLNYKLFEMSMHREYG